MAVHARPPRSAALRVFVERVWVGPSTPVYEHVIPNGALHLALRLAGPPVRVDGTDVGHAVIGGARSRYWIREVTAPSVTVGAQLVPGAAYPLLGVTARVIAERHVALGDVWANAGSLVERIAEAGEAAGPAEARVAEARLDAFEAALLARLGMIAACEIDPLVAYAARALDEGASVADVVDAVGFSHRHVASVFREHVGLSPKRYARVRRVVRAIADRRALALVAASAGFADQAHLTREVRAIAGVTPREVRGAGGGGLHVPRSDSFKTG